MEPSWQLLAETADQRVQVYVRIPLGGLTERYQVRKYGSVMQNHLTHDDLIRYLVHSMNGMK